LKLSTLSACRARHPSGYDIDVIIAGEVAVAALADERARRAAWKIVENNAADFAAYGSKG
jgi:hypothetical protein